MMKKLIVLICLGLLINSCAKEVKSEQEVYFNDFESNKLDGISNASTETYNNTKVLGRYNSSGFDLSLSNLPAHKLVEVSFDLYIHDSWDGNKVSGGIDGPDIWKFIVDGNLYVNATFSNEDCNNSGFCPPQSYPSDYPNSYNNPKTGAINPNLPGVCNLSGKIGGTSLYKITKVIEHSKATLLMQCRDQLIQTNAVNPMCDESWSIDNIRIKVINL
ncbi:hypothetical protein QWY86_11385 [Pedobacter aquatilis]|uniref:hypothetical protein n=1 Tax=Pedobacter aquatilis TaxID=351343 RepID=UPI0025B4D9B4|nr:hypothetical protein [Pedobacter aquatilis]MDN3587274.1 hypothetical protein [Pedobacter aquatilis]